MPVSKAHPTPHEDKFSSAPSAMSRQHQQTSGSANQATQPSGLLHALLKDFLDDRALAAQLGVSSKLPAQWRHLGKFTEELPYHKFGRCVRYRREDVEAFIAKMRVGGTDITAAE